VQCSRCLAVWLTFSARTTTDRILAIIPPITAFVAAGFEHSIANMYFIPVLIKATANSFWASQLAAGSFAAADVGQGLFNNLLPVTLGSILGGSLLVGLVYWFVYLRKVRSGRDNHRVSSAVPTVEMSSS
jgi:formate/nitrite transporter FocA (FNT family)